MVTLPDDTVCIVLGEQAAWSEVLDTELGVPPELVVPQPATATLVAASAANPIATRFIDWSPLDVA
jgi:hypothetical protein